MTVETMMSHMASVVDFTASPPPSNTDVYQRRLTLLNQAAEEWARHLNYAWEELYDTATLSVVSGQDYIDLPSGYSTGSLILPTSNEITINDKTHRFVNITNVKDYVASEPLVYITGNPVAGYKLNIQPTPEEDSQLAIRYYSNDLAVDQNGNSKAELELETDSTKCPDSMYLVYRAVAVHYGTDETNYAQSLNYQRAARDALTRMYRAKSENNQTTAVKEVPTLQGNPRLGR